ncbi:MAG TPA: hypothetical protein VFH78_01855 [Candidatus Thermoplasmatota archaeon]|nr:hypothetical protein [Candidatus Thermoplasmatota archaeon]
MPERRPTLARGVVVPTVVAGVVYGVLGLFFSNFLRDSATLGFGFLAAWLAFVAARVLGHLDRPRGYGLFARHVLTGVSVGFAGFAVVRGIFVEGPAPWMLLGGFGFGLYRAHRALLKDAREKEDAPRVLGLFHPKDLQALAVLATGYALLGLAGAMVLRALLGFVPGGGQMLAVAVAAYALHGARLLLAFAAEERGTPRAGSVAWLKANALQNAIVVLLLVAYAVFRTRLQGLVPYFPLVEFGLGVAIFGFVLARLRAKLRKEGSLLPTASEARDHERVVSELREPDFDSVARPVTRFIESGVGKEEYAHVVLQALPGGDARAETLRAQVLAHREPPRPPPLALEWALAAGAALTLGLGVAAFTLGHLVLRAPMPHPMLLALLLSSFALYAQQDVARAHHRPWLAMGIAAAGVALLFLDFLLFAADVGSIASVPNFVWGVVAAICALMLGMPGWASYKLDKRLRAGDIVDARRLAPALELQRELQAARKRAATMALAAFTMLLPAPWLAGWLAERGIIPSGFPDFFDDVLAVGICVAVTFGAAALVRFYGLTRGRPLVLAREKSKRERRLTLHRQLMRSIERS